ncbi:MAG: alanine:cation symporter family protein [Bacilli bacterium]|nr:alanine:cation symporter family protein [Bacilli bacterium]
MQLLENFNNFIWIMAAVIILISGIYFSLNLKFIQFKFKKMFRSLNKDAKMNNSITPKKALMMVLAGRVGVGSISGVALAIYTGGVGSIFWMWITTIFAITNSFGETVLGIKYKEKDEGNIYKGGPSYYIKNGLRNKSLAIIYAILIIICYVGGFLSIQANTITKAVLEFIDLDVMIIAIILSLAVLIIIFGGVKKISDVTSKLVPIMIILYLFFGTLILIINYEQIPEMLFTIVKSAFSLEAAVGGFLGTFLIGLQRGVFSNEAGMGTGSIASSIVDSEAAAEQGYIQMLGVYITTMLICTATAIIIMTSDYQNLKILDINGIEITQYAFKYHLGNFGNIIVFISIIMFAFSTILTGYYYSESSLKAIFDDVSSKKVLLLKTLIIVVVFLGCLISANLLWLIVDIFSAILVIINVYSLLKLRKEIKEEYNKSELCDKI